MQKRYFCRVQNNYLNKRHKLFKNLLLYIISGSILWHWCYSCVVCFCTLHVSTRRTNCRQLKNTRFGILSSWIRSKFREKRSPCSKPEMWKHTDSVLITNTQIVNESFMLHWKYTSTKIGVILINALKLYNEVMFRV